MAESVTADGECVLYHAGRRWRVVSGVAEDLGAIEGAKPGQLLSPAGDQALIVHGHDLAVLDISSGAERRLPADGEERYAGGQCTCAALLAIARRHADTPLMPFGRSWITAGKNVMSLQEEQR